MRQGSLSGDVLVYQVGSRDFHLEGEQQAFVYYNHRVTEFQYLASDQNELPMENS